MPRKKVVESTAVSTTKLTPAGTLTKLRTNYRGMTRENAQNRANFGAAVKIAVDEKHLHKGAWAIAMREDKMEPAELRSHYEHLEHYRRELGLIDRATKTFQGFGPPRPGRPKAGQMAKTMAGVSPM